jgi:transcriptional regulator with XRE-family HTH domain
VENVRQIVATNLRNARARIAMSQEELAHKAKIDRTYVSGIEREVRNPTIDVLAKLADALNTTSAALLTDAGAAQSKP